MFFKIHLGWLRVRLDDLAVAWLVKYFNHKYFPFSRLRTR